jgi:hypothetical protein
LEGQQGVLLIGGAKAQGGTHLAFTAPTRADVDSFYRAALPPADGTMAAGVKAHYHQTIMAPSSSILTATTSSGVSPAGMRRAAIRACRRRILA